MGIQEHSIFNLNIQYSENPDSLIEIQVTSSEMVQELHQILMERMETYMETCFSLVHKGTVLDQFSELKSIPTLCENDILMIKQEPYTLREIRLHVRHLRDILNTLDLTNAFNGTDGASLTYVNAILGPDNIIEHLEKQNMIKLLHTPIATQTTEESLLPSPDILIVAHHGDNLSNTQKTSNQASKMDSQNSKEIRLLPLHPVNLKEKHIPCLRSVHFNQWNPPPSQRKLKGDLAYLTVTTIEEKVYHITACRKGFYINLSTDTIFNPLPIITNHGESQIYHSLFDLLSKVSFKFKRNIVDIMKKRCNQNSLEKVPLPFMTTTSWIIPQLQHNSDYYRAEDAYESRLGFEDHVPGQNRDWNEELQSTREMIFTNGNDENPGDLANKMKPSNALYNKIIRDRAVFKVGSDLTQAAIKGAQCIVNGNALPINPGESEKMHMFIWNNIFFSYGFDIRDHYKEVGGDSAAYVAPANDLKGVELYNDLDIEKLCTLGTAIIDFKGYRVTAQTIIPGILEREQEELVVYGSIDSTSNPSTNLSVSDDQNTGPTDSNCQANQETCKDKKILIRTHPEYVEILEKAANRLHIAPHSVVISEDAKDGISDNGTNENTQPYKSRSINLYTSYETKGIIGNDKRKYLLDLFRTLPPDMNFTNYIPRSEHNEGFDKEEVVCLKISQASTLKYGLPPKSYKHSLAILRAELVEAFMEHVLVVRNCDSSNTQIRNLLNLFNGNGRSSSDLGAAAFDDDLLANISKTDSTFLSTNGRSIKNLLTDNNDETIPNDNQTGQSGSSNMETQVLELQDKLNKLLGLVVTEKTSMDSGQHQHLCNNQTNDNNVLNQMQANQNQRQITLAGNVSPNLSDKDSAIDSMDINALEDRDESDDDKNKIKNELLNIEHGMVFRTKFPISYNELKFNPDAFSNFVTHDPCEKEKLKAEQNLLLDAADFIIHHQIPELIGEFTNLSVIPIEGSSLVSILHGRGINIRYLGILTKMIYEKTKCLQPEGASKLNYLINLTCSEMIIRACKHVLKDLIRNCDSSYLCIMISHFLNCLFCPLESVPLPAHIMALSLNVQNTQSEYKINQIENSINNNGNMANRRKNGKKKKSGTNTTGSHNSNYNSSESNYQWNWTHLTPGSLWKILSNDIKENYLYEFDDEFTTFHQFCKANDIKFSAILRRLCIVTGIQIVLREYSFESCVNASPTHKSGNIIFCEDDIINLIPIVKHMNHKSSDAHAFYLAGQARVQDGALKEALELFSESLNIMNNIYGPLHPEIASCLRLMSRLCYLIGERLQALAFQYKATIMSERIHGIDHPNTILDYVNLAIYYLANFRLTCSLKLLYRARYLLLLIVLQNDHPEFISIDSNLGLILYANGMYDQAMIYLENALYLSKKYYGEVSIKTAVIHHLIAGVYSCQGNFRLALMKEKQSYAIYKILLGEGHDKTIESATCIKHLTKQAVAMQRCLNAGKYIPNNCASNGPEKSEGNGLNHHHNNNNNNNNAKINNRYFSNTFLSSLHIQRPAITAILDLVNAINGIMYVQIKSSQDFAKLTDTDRQIILTAIFNSMQQNDQLTNRTSLLSNLPTQNAINESPLIANENVCSINVD